MILTKNPTACLMCFSSSQAEPAYWTKIGFHVKDYERLLEIKLISIEKFSLPRMLCSTIVLIQPSLLSQIPHY